MAPKWFKWIDRVRYSLHRLATLLFPIALFLVSMSLPIAAQQATTPQTPLQITQTVSDAKALEQQGRHYYEAEQYSEAIAIWQQAIAIFQSTGDRLEQAKTLSNLPSGAA